jgi:hypothetical protein
VSVAAGSGGGRATVSPGGDESVDGTGGVSPLPS